MADVMARYRAPAGPPPFEAVGGINGRGVGLTGYMTLDLQPGAYAAVRSRLLHVFELRDGLSARETACFDIPAVQQRLA